MRRSYISQRIRTRRLELEHQADAILRAADRRRRPKRKRKPASPVTSAEPRRLTLADLGLLRRKGLVP